MAIKHMNKGIVFLLSIVLVSLFIFVGCTQQEQEQMPNSSLNDTNDTMPPEINDSESTQLNESTPQETEEQGDSLLVLEKCEREDIFGVALQYAGCNLFDQDSVISMKIANRGRIPVEGLYLYILNVTNDQVIDTTDLSAYLLGDDELYIPAETIEEFDFSLIDIENEFGAQVQKIHLAPILTLNNGTKASCRNYRIGFKPYDCRRNTR